MAKDVSFSQDAAKRIVDVVLKVENEALRRPIARQTQHAPKIVRRFANGGLVTPVVVRGIPQDDGILAIVQTVVMGDDFATNGLWTANGDTRECLVYHHVPASMYKEFMWPEVVNGDQNPIDERTRILWTFDVAGGAEVQGVPMLQPPIPIAMIHTMPQGARMSPGCTVR